MPEKLVHHRVLIGGRDVTTAVSDVGISMGHNAVPSATFTVLEPVVNTDPKTGVVTVELFENQVPRAQDERVRELAGLIAQEVGSWNSAYQHLKRSIWQILEAKVTTPELVYSPVNPLCGSYSIHCKEGVTGPDDKPALYVNCSCGRSYAFGHYVDKERLTVWLSDHEADVSCKHSRPNCQTANRETGKTYCHDCGVTYDG